MLSASRFSLVCQLFFSFTLSAQAEDAPKLSIELNAVAAQENACRLIFLVENSLGSDLDALVYETVVFDKDGQVMTITLFDFGHVPDGRPRVSQFDLPAVDCSNVGRVLLNGTHACRGEGLGEDACSEALQWSSRTDVEILG